MPFACLDLKSIKQKIDKAEKKEKKANKKKSKPAPKQMTAYAEEKTNEQKENNLPLAHIPRPSDTPLDHSKPRRIVRIKQEMFYQSLGPKKIAEILIMVTGNQERLGYIQQPGEKNYLSSEQQCGFINPNSFSGFIHPADTLHGVIDPNQEIEYSNNFLGYINTADTLPGVIDPNQEIGYFDNFHGYIHPADTLPGVIDPNQQIVYSENFPGYIHPADTLPGVINPNQDIGYSNNFPGYIHPGDTLPGVIDSNQEMKYSFPGYIHPADTLPEMMDTYQNMGYPCQVPRQNSFKPEISSDSLGGFPQSKRTTPEAMLGYAKPKNTVKDSLFANPLILPKPQRQIFKCASPEQFKSLCKRSTMKSTQKQRSKNTNQKLLSINSNVTI